MWGFFICQECTDLVDYDRTNKSSHYFTPGP